MGTTTFYLRHNDLRRRLKDMSKEELNKFDSLSPYKEDNSLYGWNVPMELHNGNVYFLVFWKGRLLKLNDAPKTLDRKYYDKYTGKTRKEYQWTILKGALLNEINYLDKEFKKSLRKKRKTSIFP